MPNETPSLPPIRAFNASRVPQPRSGTPEPRSTTSALDIEVGCGAGLHPIRYAQANPGRLLIAIEHTPTRFELFQRRLKRHPEIRNVQAIQAEAVSWITHRVEPLSVDRYFFLYPNPYPKRTDLNKRWHAMPFFSQILKTLKRGGTFTLATNEEFYFSEALDYLMGPWGLILVQARELRGLDALGGVARTHFEKKYLQRGEVCRDLVVRKP